MHSLFLIVAIFSLITAVTVVTQVRNIGWLVWLWFVSGWITGELAIWLIGLQGAFVALWVIFIGTQSIGFSWAMVAFLITWAFLSLSLRDSFDAGYLFGRALQIALGPHFFEEIPKQRRLKLTQSIRSQEWLSPFRFRRPGVQYIRNLSHSDYGTRGKLDVYLPVRGGLNRPVLLQVHGGAWMMGHKSEQAQPLLHRMVELGWVAVSINYRLAPRDPYPAQIIDVKKAITWVKSNIANYGGDPDFIVITGGSAGGHLSLLAGLTPNHPDWQPGFEEADTSLQGVLSLYPVVDFTNRYGIRRQDKMDAFIAHRIMQKTSQESPDLFEDGSPLSWIHRPGTANVTPPCFVVQGTHDSLVWVEEVRQFVAEFTPIAKSPVVYAELDRAQHAFDIFHSPRTSHFLNAAAIWLEWVKARHQAEGR